MIAYPKPLRTAAKAQRRTRLAADRAAEAAEKAAVRRRDQRCRFPECGCRRLGLRLEVSHATHKGTRGRDEKRAVSVRSRMMLLCEHRHQHGAVSIHAGTLEAEPLTDAGFEGPVAWWVDKGAITGDTSPEWVRVASESSVGRLEPTTTWQARLLADLARMAR